MNDPIAQLTASHIDGSPAVLGCRRMPCGYANANYRLETENGVFLLRHCLLQDRVAVEYELNVLDHLRGCGFPVPAALRFAGGERWIAAPGDTHVVLLDWLDGIHPRPDRSNVAIIAGALARLHNLPPPAGHWWHRQNPLGMGAVTRLAAELGPRPAGMYRFFVEEFAELRDPISTPLPCGLIHGDVFTDNTLFRDDGELLALLDFQDANEDALLFDLAMTIHGFCFPEEEWSPDLATVLVDRYDAERPLTGTERELLPSYLRWCPLTMMGWHLEQLLRRPDEGNENRAAEFQRRIETMKINPLPLRSL